MRALLVLQASLVLLAAASARADCCRVVKVDPATPETTVRVCAPDAEGGCGALLFGGTLGLGEGQEVCTEGRTVVYQEYDESLGAFGAPVEAVCEGADVEI